MKDFVVHVSEDVCVKNGRDPDAAKLIEIAKTFGSVEPLDSALAAERAKNQVVINNLTAQIDLIKEQEVTPEELEVLRALRKKSEKEGKVYAEITKDTKVTVYEELGDPTVLFLECDSGIYTADCTVTAEEDGSYIRRYGYRIHR